MEYMTVQDAAVKWRLSDRRIRILCAEEKIPGVVKEGHSYKIPINALKPIDGRIFRGKEIPSEYQELFGRIDAKKAELEKRRPLTQGELERLSEEFLIDFTYNSNAIEGNTLTLQETALVLEGITIDQKPLKEHLEIVGHKDAFFYVQDLVKSKVRITEKVIKDIHSLVLIDRPLDRGSYRKIPVKIMGAIHEPPQPYLVSVQMEELIQKYLNRTNKLHFIEKAARFHLDFESIHPFIDGNGRTGRLLMNLDIMKNGYPPINVKFTDRRRYYECFHTYHDKNNASNMIRMIAEYLEQELDRYLKMLDI